MADSSTSTGGIAADVPEAIANYLVAIALQNHAPAYLQVTPEGHLISSGGILQKYGLQAIETGDYVGETFYYLEGFFPLARTEVMSHLQLEQGPTVDVHIIADQARDDTEQAGAGWILILDTSAEAERLQRLQQKGNDLSLLRQQYAKLLDRSLGDNTTPAQQAEAASQVEASEQTVSVLIVKFCGPHIDRLSVGKPSTLKAINASLSFITQVIVEEGGLINHILGGTAAAFFGLLPTRQSAPHQAVYAARRVLKRLMAEAPSYSLYPLSPSDPDADPQTSQIGIGASITTGEATAGILQSQGCRRLNAVGDPIQSAAHIGDRIQPGTITIDQATFEAIHPYQHEFQPLKKKSKKSPPLVLYRLNFEQT